MTEKNQYGIRNHMGLDAEGGYYMRHVMAMTAERLHNKSDIAGELAWRDACIARLAEAGRELLLRAEQEIADPEDVSEIDAMRAAIARATGEPQA